MADTGAAIGNFVVTNDKREEIRKKLDELRSCQQKLDDLQKKLYNLSEEDARMTALKGLTSISPDKIWIWLWGNHPTLEMAKEIQRKLKDSIASLKTVKEIYEIYKITHESSITVAVGDDLEKSK